MPNVHLNLLSLTNCTPITIGTYAFLDSSVKIIDASDFHLCCILPANSKCMVKNPWYMTCKGIFYETKMKHICSTVLIVVIFINFIFLVILKETKRVHTGAFRKIMFSIYSQ